MPRDTFRCSSRYFRNQQEFRDWFMIRSSGFGAWYVPPVPKITLGNNRHVHNALAAVFPEFFFQVRNGEGCAVAYLATAAGYWSGDPNSLHNMTYVNAWPAIPKHKMAPITAAHVLACEVLKRPGLFQPIVRRVRARKLTHANTMFLLAITVHPGFHGHRLPTLLLDAAKDNARQLGLEHVAAAFRPTGYGSYKAERRAAHSDALFDEYCHLTDAQGLPADPWLRIVVRHGGQLLRVEPRSFGVSGSIEGFERFRRTHRADAWYSPSPNVWECGETCTWHVDPARRSVLAVEPNYWGHFDLGVRAAPAARA
jgi:GNAT superfamily N-acetyltransferase